MVRICAFLYILDMATDITSVEQEGHCWHHRDARHRLSGNFLVISMTASSFIRGFCHIQCFSSQVM